jgi:Zn-dependent peptidase ImmA (M78 family)
MALGNNQLAIYQARILLEKVGFADTPINPWKIVTLLKEQGLPFELFEESSGSIEGCTMKNNGKVSIILNKDIKSLTRRKFTLAHELGHAWLRSHTGKFSCESATIETRTKNERESEANAFAAELLMPEDNFLSDIRNLNPTVDALHELGDVKYGTSITSTALRFAELTTIPCAVVLSEKGVVKWV